MNEQLKRKQVVQQLMQKKILVTTRLLKQLKQPETLNEYYKKYCEEISSIFPTQYKLEIIHDHESEPRKHKMQDFVSHLSVRFKLIERMIQGRQEMKNLTSIARLKNTPDRQKISVIGIVMSKGETKNEHIMLEIEDKSGQTKVLISKNSPAFEQSKDIMMDEVIGIVGTTGNEIIFANSIVYPDIPIAEEKKAPEEGYALVISDLHVGSNNFLGRELNGFLDWLNGITGTPEQQEIASKVKYLFIVGDLVEGVGIFPGQECELEIPDIYKQYKVCAQYLSKIPKHIRTVVIPGNHDALRLSEPQPKLDKHIAKPIWDVQNLTMCGNPCTVNIHGSQNFGGFNVLMYHGYSYSYYADNVSSIRNSGRNVSDRTDLVMKHLLVRRHLAPTHGSSLYMPDPKYDALFIDTIPDLFLSGHIHKLRHIKYRGTDLICGSCWQSMSDFQAKMGHTPEPCKVPAINLQTRNIKILDFTK